jgi:hypothetical protein
MLRRGVPIRLVFHLGLYHCQDLFGCIPRLKVIPNAYRELRRVDGLLGGPPTYLSIVREVNGPKLRPVFVVQDEEVVFFPQKELLWEVRLDQFQ